MCSEWFEVHTNNDRPYLEKWIEEHQKLVDLGQSESWISVRNIEI